MRPSTRVLLLFVVVISLSIASPTDLGDMPRELVEKIYQNARPLDRISFSATSHLGRSIFQDKDAPFVALKQSEPNCVFGDLVKSENLNFIRGALNFYIGIRGKQWVIAKLRTRCNDGQLILRKAIELDNINLVVALIQQYGLSDYQDWIDIQQAMESASANSPRVREFLLRSLEFHDAVTSYEDHHSGKVDTMLRNRKENYLFTTNVVKEDPVSNRWFSTIHVAIEKNDRKLVALLLRSSTRLTITDSEYRTPLEYAAWLGRVEVVKLLLKHRVPVNYHDPAMKRNVIHWLAKSRQDGENMKKIYNLLYRHADLELADCRENLPLHYAVESFNHPLTWVLAKSKTAIQAQNVYGNTPLHQAAFSNNAYGTTILLDQGAKVNSRNGRAQTPLMMAAAANREKIVQILLEKSDEVDVNIPDAHSRTPLLMAVIYRRKTLTEILLQRGALVHLASQGGQNPMQYAKRHGYTEIYDLLQHHYELQSATADFESNRLE